MTDLFGFDTTKDIRRQQAEAAEQRQIIAQQGSPGDQLGNALGNIFGPTIRKSLETRGARKERAAELQTIAGGDFTKKQAKDIAKFELPREFNDIREAKKVESITGEMEQFVAEQTANNPNMSPHMKQALGELYISRRLSVFGLTQQAAQMREKGLASYQVAIGIQDERDELNVSMTLDRAKTKEANARAASLMAEEAPKDRLIRLQNRRTQLQKLILAKAPDSEFYKKEIEEINSQILFDRTRVGRTVNDPVEGTASAFTKSALGDLQKAHNESSATFDSLIQVAESFKPEFLTLQGKAVNFFLTAADKVGALSEGEKVKLTEYADFTQRANEQLNLYIQRITGAQMSEIEVVRLKGGVPNPDDSPTVYQAKWKNTVRDIMAMNARTTAALSRGRPDIVTPLATFYLTDAEFAEVLGLTGDNRVKTNPADNPVQTLDDRMADAMSTIDELIEAANATTPAEGK